LPKYKTLLFDLEGDGLLKTITKIHVLCIKEYETGKTWRFREGEMITGVQMLMDAELIVGHNIIDYDLKVIEKITGIKIDVKIRDTLVLVRLLYPNQADKDFRAAERGEFPNKLIGRHSLKAWGYRLGEFKGDYADEKEDEAKSLGIVDELEILKFVWGSWNQPMEDYCGQDVIVTEKLYSMVTNEIMITSYPERPIIVEHIVAELMSQQEENGIYFDVQGALKLDAELLPLVEAITEECLTAFPSKFIPDKMCNLADIREDFNKVKWEDLDPELEEMVYQLLASGELSDVVPQIVIPKKTLRFKDVTRASKFAGQPYTPVNLDVFNPGSRQQIASRLIELGYVPDEFTPTGAPSINEETLGRAAEIIPIAKPISDLFMIKKRRSQLATGDEAWLKKVTPEGKIHHHVNPCGAVTGRMTHSSPNLGQVPATVMKKRTLEDGSKEEYVAYGREGGWGAECRALFFTPEGFKMVGSDLSGIELRCLAHEMAKYDDGEYGKLLLNEDIHIVNQLAAGLETRDQAKRFIYAFLYGSGDEKTGSIVAPTATISQQKKIGAELKAKFLKGLPALNKVQKDIKKSINSSGYLIGLDGRRLHVRSAHSALNTLLQSAGAIIAKHWIIQIDDDIADLGYEDGWKDYASLLTVHDERQLAARDGLENTFAELMVKAANKVQGILDFKMPIDASFRIGKNWHECH
jgi:DNA polymerase I-like protein with 3'-5' exonuclease and polymerase domains